MMRTFILIAILIAVFIVPQQIGTSIPELFDILYAEPVYQWVMHRYFDRSGMVPGKIQIVAFSLFLLLLALFFLYKIFSSGTPNIRFAPDTIQKIDNENIYLLIRRSQGSAIFGRVIFRLTVRAYIPQSSVLLIRKYRLRNQLIYSSKSLKNLATDAVANFEVGDLVRKINPIVGWKAMMKGTGLAILGRFAMSIRVKHLINGKIIKCKELHEMMEAEKAVITACHNLHTFLKVAETFDGREMVMNLAEIKEEDIK